MFLSANKKEVKETVDNRTFALDQRIGELEKLTERINAKRSALVSSSEVLSAMLESCPLPMWVKSSDGAMLFFNDAYARIYNIKPEEYLGKKDLDFWPDDVAHNFMDNDAEVMNMGTQYKVEIIPTQKAYRVDADRDHITVVKWKVKLEGKVIGVAGVVTSVFP